MGNFSRQCFKKFSACGTRIGVLASKNKRVIESAIKFAQARLSLPMVEQLAVVPLLENSQKYLKKIIFEYKKRRDIVFQEMRTIPEVITVEPKGAFYLFVKIPWLKDSDHFAEWLLTKFADQGKTVLVAPGTGFYATPKGGRDEFRIAFVLSSSKLKEAMKILKKGLEKYRNNTTLL
ncbi:MAG: aminotransferase class I/II-fold pyridoxal phosphate-dependent enzyme [Patescibacteria group bacterium]|nr:aminotransferase class I/II-fold pyridoxal phosphate-dependent enzyme [Patescibacteria group bacterium]